MPPITIWAGWVFVEEIASGRKPWRERQSSQVLEELQGGDAMIVAELSRLGSSMLECMEILALATRKGIRGYSVKVSWQLDHSIQSKILPGVLDGGRGHEGATRQKFRPSRHSKFYGTFLSFVKFTQPYRKLP